MEFPGILMQSMCRPAAGRAMVCINRILNRVGRIRCGVSGCMLDRSQFALGDNWTKRRESDFFCSLRRVEMIDLAPFVHGSHKPGYWSSQILGGPLIGLPRSTSSGIRSTICRNRCLLANRIPSTVAVSMMVCMAPDDHPNNSRLRELLQDTGLTQAVALTFFNRGKAEPWTSPAFVDKFQLPVRSCSNASGLSWSR